MTSSADNAGCLDVSAGCWIFVARNISWCSWSFFWKLQNLCAGCCYNYCWLVELQKKIIRRFWNLIFGDLGEQVCKEDQQKADMEGFAAKIHEKNWSGQKFVNPWPFDWSFQDESSDCRFTVDPFSCGFEIALLMSHSTHCSDRCWYLVQTKSAATLLTATPGRPCTASCWPRPENPHVSALQPAASVARLLLRTQGFTIGLPFFNLC